MSESHAALQRNQQRFLASITEQQDRHTQSLIQSQMEFQAQLFAKYFGPGNDKWAV